MRRGQQRLHQRGRQPVRTLHPDRPNRTHGSRIHVHPHRRRPGLTLNPEAQEHLRLRISPVLEPPCDCVSRCLQEKSVEWVARTQREVARHPVGIGDRIEAQDSHLLDQYRRALRYDEREVDVLLGTPDHGVDFDFEVSRLAVQQLQPFDIGLEVPLVERALGPETHPPQHRTRGEEARIGRGDERPHALVVDRTVAAKLELPYHQFLRLPFCRSGGRHQRRQDQPPGSQPPHQPASGQHPRPTEGVRSCNGRDVSIRHEKANEPIPVTSLFSAAYATLSKN